MKKINLFVLAIFATITSFAQPVLTAANINIIVGETFVYKMDTLTTNAGSAGINQTWNFASIVSTNNVNATALTTVGTAFPTASVKVSQTSGDHYYSQTSTEQNITGVNVGGVIHTFTDPMKMLQYPFQYNSTFTDSFKESYTSGVTFYRKGSVSMTADAYGTLVLPSGTYTNVLRVKRVQIYADSAAGIGVMFSFNDETYNFYKEGNHMPIRTVATITMTTPSNSTVVKSNYFLGTIVTSVKDYNNNDLANIEIFPNPTSRKLNVHFVENKYENVSFSLTDLKGSNFQINTLQNGSNYSLEANNIPSGIYQLTIISNKEIIGSKKIQFINE